MARFDSRRLGLVSATFVLLAWPVSPVVALDFPGPAPGPAQAHVDDTSIVLENNVLRASWKIVDGHLRPDVFLNKLSGERLDWGDQEVFRFTYARSPLPPVTITASKMHVHGSPEEQSLRIVDIDFRAENLTPGKRVSLNLESAAQRIWIQWRVELRDGLSYIRQSWDGGRAGEREVDEEGSPEIIQNVALEGPVKDAYVKGVVDGSPVVTETIFLGLESPFAKNAVDRLAGHQRAAAIHCYDARAKELWYHFETGDPNAYRHSSVIGVSPPSQMRRAFLYYLESARAMPYRPFLQYNNGSEIGCEYWRKQRYGQPGEFERFLARQEEEWIKLIDTYGRELVQKRGVVIDSFVHDHGWDDPNLVWLFHTGYPKGFAPARAAAERYNSSLGVWFSPWGGYSGKKLRVEGGQAQGFEINKSGLSLAGSSYGFRFERACRNMVRLYGINYFKFDGFAGGVNKPGPESFASDTDWLMWNISELRWLEPKVFINATTGTWPSPFWLRWVDSIWRQGHDTNLGGKGSDRQRWITYRDGEVLHGTLERSPLFPLSSLMIHGIYVNKLPLTGNPYDPKNPPATHDPVDVTAEIRSFFGTGVNCQELYINPELMTPALWDVLAEAAKWSRANSDVLADTHWVGGDPLKGEIYGFASWQPRKGILTLRNPDNQPGRITLDVAKVFELPAGAATHYTLKSPWKEDAAQPGIEAEAGKPVEFALKPFEVRVFDAPPAGTKARRESR